MKIPRSTLLLLLAASAFGYFVDVYDLLIFSVVRNASLTSLGVSPGDSLRLGLTLLNWQMCGLLLGGLVFGSLADRRGRLGVLFGSIAVYSIANLLNAHVSTLAMYGLMRFFAGFGLAGQLGAGVSLVVETMSTSRRGYGTMIIAGVGLLGACAAGLIGTHVTWQQAYIIGGIMGLLLLVLRLGLVESPAFKQMTQQTVAKGSFLMLLGTPSRLLRYIRCIGVGIATYLVVGLVITGAPEYSNAMRLPQRASAGVAVLLCYLSMSAGDVICTLLSQLSRSRKIPLVLFNGIVLCGLVTLVVYPPTTLKGFYVLCCILGFGCGFWSLVATFAAEQFGTNLRATVTTTVPNFIRGALIPITFCFTLLKPHLGLLHATMILGICLPALAIASILSLPETFHRDMIFLEV